MRKRKREDVQAKGSESGKGGTEGLKEGETDQDQYEGLTPYEIQRAKLIARNRRRMIELGIPLAISQLKAHIPSQARKRSTAPEKRKKPDVKEAGRDPGEVRRSKRLKAQAEGPDGEEGEVDPELQQCIAEGQCPRCERKLNRGYRQHLERCSGAEERRSAPRRPVPAKTMEERLAQLELSGLIDMSDDEAQFVVIGSTGNHYMVTLAAQRHKCQCVDHRIRKHDCKHIKLCLKNIGAPDGNDWHQALDRSIEAQKIVELDEQDAAAAQVKRGRSGSKAKTKKAGTTGGGHGETKPEPGAASPADVPRQTDYADGNTEQQAANQEATVLKAESASGMAPTARTSSRIRARAAAPSTALKFL